jgi:hypothetical protein
VRERKRNKRERKKEKEKDTTWKIRRDRSIDRYVQIEKYVHTDREIVLYDHETERVKNRHRERENVQQKTEKDSNTVDVQRSKLNRLSTTC